MNPSTPTSPRIGIDGSSVVGARTGIGYATSELLGALAGCWPESWPAARVLVNSARRRPPADDAWLGDPRLVLERRRVPGKLLLRGWQWAGWPSVEWLVGDVDLFHAPASFIPPARAARRVITVHDLYFQYAPQHVEPYGGGYFAKTFAKALPEVDQIIAVSAFTRDELLKFYDLRPERISVVHQGLDSGRFHPDPRPDDLDRLASHNIQRPYLLCIATIEPRKNMVTLIEAYARARGVLRAARQNPPNLVITGQPGWGIKALTQRLAEARVEDSVTLTGYLPNETLPALYRQAMGFVFPSLYEGFGMPVLEAMACGCPTLVARTGALPEIAGEAAEFVNPRDSAALARALARFVTDPSLRAALRAAGLERARQFSWTATARATLDVYRRALEKTPRCMTPDL